MKLLPCRPIVQAAFALFTDFSFSSCASISVCKIQANPKESFVLPKKIYVREFTGNPSVFRVDRKGDSLSDFRRKTSRQLGADLVTFLNHSVLPSELLAEGDPPPWGNCWIVSGSFERVNQGSRSLRTLIGLGAGGTKIETAVQVSSIISGKPVEILSFHTTGGSNTEPGPGILIGPPDPTTVFPLIWGVTMPGLSKDITLTAKEIAAEIADYLAKHGVPSKDPKLKVKLR